MYMYVYVILSVRDARQRKECPGGAFASVSIRVQSALSVKSEKRSQNIHLNVQLERSGNVNLTVRGERQRSANISAQLERLRSVNMSVQSERHADIRETFTDTHRHVS